MVTEKDFGDGNYSAETIKLIRAVQENSIFQARKAIARGANVKVRGKDNNTLLHICLSAPMAAVLLNNRAEINARNDFNQIPLHSSMRRALTKLSQFLIDQGSDLNAQENNGTAPLHLAQDPKINNFILDRSANPNIQDSVGDTPLHVAVRYKGNPIVNTLLAHGASKNIDNAAGKDAIDEFRVRTRKTIHELVAMRQALNASDVSTTIPTAPTNTPTTKTSLSR